MKPTKYPEWAINEITETEVINGIPEELPNKLEPTVGFKLSGELFREPVPRQYLNYQFDLLNDWVVYFDERYDIENPSPDIINVSEIYIGGVLQESITPSEWSSVLSRLDTAEDDIDLLEISVSTLQGDVIDLDGRVDDLEIDVANIQTIITSFPVRTRIYYMGQI